MKSWQQWGWQFAALELCWLITTMKMMITMITMMITTMRMVKKRKWKAGGSSDGDNAWPWSSAEEKDEDYIRMVLMAMIKVRMTITTMRTARIMITTMRMIEKVGEEMKMKSWRRRWRWQRVALELCSCTTSHPPLYSTINITLSITLGYPLHQHYPQHYLHQDITEKISCKH